MELTNGVIEIYLSGFRLIQGKASDSNTILSLDLAVFDRIRKRATDHSRESLQVIQQDSYLGLDHRLPNEQKSLL